MSHARGEDGTGQAATPAIPEGTGTDVPEGALEPAAIRAGDVRPGAEEVTPVRPAPAKVKPAKARPTRISGVWIAVIGGLVVLTLLLVFILQNLDSVTVHFFGAEGSMPLAIAMLFSALGGAALVALIGGARILQLRKQARRR
jgi:uncharacterized integral membrane protein